MTTSMIIVVGENVINLSHVLYSRPIIIPGDPVTEVEPKDEKCLLVKIDNGDEIVITGEKDMQEFRDKAGLREWFIQ